MIYQYTCPKDGCQHNCPEENWRIRSNYAWEVIKPAKDSSKPEDCPSCRSTGNMLFSKTLLSGTSVQEAEFNPGLGTIVKNKYHRQELCKQRGFVEIGNDYSKPDKIHTEQDKNHAARRKSEWNSTLNSALKEAD